MFFYLASFFASIAPIENLTLEEKVGQLLMVHFHGSVANDESKSLIQETKVGSFIYYNWSNELSSFEQVSLLSEGLQKQASENKNPIPLLISVDQEGGPIARLNVGFTHFPANMALAETGDVKLAFEVARATGTELLAAGVNMNLAPVVDINSNPKNPIIGVRSFGNETEKVVLFGEAMLAGFKKANIISTLKHFPGHGDVGIDSHLDLPTITKSMEELKKQELVPFTKLHPETDAIMTAHILVPAFDSEFPATLSKPTLDYLRNTIGFEGVIVADSLIMGGVLKKCKTVEKAAVLAVNAGSDLLILGGRLLEGEKVGYELTAIDIKQTHQAIVDAVNEGIISKERLDEAVTRVLKLKRKSLLSKNDQKIDFLKHQSLAYKVAGKALKQKGELDQPIDPKTTLFVTPKILEKYFINEAATFVYTLSTDEEIEQVKKKAEECEAICVLSYNAWKNPSQIKLINALMELDKPTVLMVTRDPMDADLFPKANLTYQLFNPTNDSLEVVFEKIFAE